MCGLTFELTPTAEARLVRPGGEDGTARAARPYKACRSGSGVERGVRRRLLRRSRAHCPGPNWNCEAWIMTATMPASLPFEWCSPVGTYAPHPALMGWRTPSDPATQPEP
jgi:hypothetical protein